jgi:hypothetical protein
MYLIVKNPYLAYDFLKEEDYTLSLTCIVEEDERKQRFVSSP